MARLSQETIAIIGVGIAMIALGLSVAESLRDEMRADRAEARADREAIREEMRAIRAEARADREQFERQILRLIQGQGILFGLIEGRSQDGGEADDAPDEAPPAE